MVEPAWALTIEVLREYRIPFLLATSGRWWWGYRRAKWFFGIPTKWSHQTQVNGLIKVRDKDVAFMKLLGFLEHDADHIRRNGDYNQRPGFLGNCRGVVVGQS